MLLLFVALLNNAMVTLMIGVVGLVAGFLVARATTLSRAAIVALAGFAAAAALGAVTLLRGVL